MSNNDPDPEIYSLKYARQQMTEHNISQLLYAAFRAQRNRANKRGIAFRFTLVEWCEWWVCELEKLGPTAQRGLREGQFMMCRVDDAGPYASGNVYCGTGKQNQADIRRLHPGEREKKIGDRNRGENCWLSGRTGDSHPRSKPILTPRGRFESANLAAAAFGLTRQAICLKLKHGHAGWNFDQQSS